MILLLSRQLGEASTEAVSDWLERLGGRYFRLNVEDLQYPSTFSYDPAGGVLHLEDPWSGEQRSLRLDDVRVVWYRRWSYHDKYCEEHVDHVFDDRKRQMALAQFLSRELTAVGQAIFARLRRAHWLSDAVTSKIDKMLMLDCAREVGFDVPETLIATSREAVTRFMAEGGGVITKALGLSGYIATLENSSMAAYTTEPSAELVAEGPAVFFPSLLQRTIDKSYELRCFVLGDEVSSMAIFSQQDAQTTVDFRRYNREKPNRSVPYRLPPEVHDKLLALFRMLGLDTGSADILRARDGRYVFLEINPIGQFGMVSIPCNYGLEKKVASYLIAHDEIR